MIIPKDIRKNKFKNGDKVVLLKKIERNFYNITEGHEFVYLGKDDYGYILLDEETGIIIDHIYSDSFLTLKLNYNQAKDIHKKIKDKNKLNSFILKNCPNKDISYHDRDEIDVCKINSNRYCQPSLKCMEHISKDKYKNNTFVKNYIRNLKINNIIK